MSAIKVGISDSDLDPIMMAMHWSVHPHDVV